MLDKQKMQPVKAGWLETVILAPWGVKLRAKLDTGAKTSSLHAIEMQRFMRNGEHWVRFKTASTKLKNKLAAIELPVLRDVKIKDHRDQAAVRPVVEMTFCLGGHIYTSEFSLVDRSQFNYSVLLGRSMLQQGIYIDPAATFTLKSDKKMCLKLIEAYQQVRLKSSEMSE